MGYIWLCVIGLLFLILLFCPLNLRVEFGYSKNAAKQRLTVWLNGFKFYKNSFDQAVDVEKTAKPNKKPETGSER